MTNEKVGGLPEEWPEYVMLRDTRLHDDMGGLGQLIYTTAGAGYTKRKYIREDIAALSAHGLPAVDANLIADLKRCLDDVATEMRARGRCDSRFTQLSARLPALAGKIKESGT